MDGKLSMISGKTRREAFTPATPGNRRWRSRDNWKWGRKMGENWAENGAAAVSLLAASMDTLMASPPINSHTDRGRTKDLKWE